MSTDSESIILNIKSFVFKLFTSQKIQLLVVQVSTTCMDFFSLSVIPISLMFQLVPWVSPKNACLKLNFNGASRGNPGISRGWVCRSSSGIITMAYYEYCNIHSSLVAETSDVLSGLKLLNTSTSAIWLELDSLALVQIIREEINCLWHIHYYVLAIKDYLNMSVFFILHVIFEGNCVAGGLTNVAIALHDNKVFHSIKDLPMQ